MNDGPVEISQSPSVNGHAMTQGIIPLRYPGLPGVVKLPKRYEKAALGDPKTAKYRKVSICSGTNHMKETISARLDDLMSAMMWVKQELILLRQHDILLKHQFFNIHDSIQSLQPKRSLSSSTSSNSVPSPTTPLPQTSTSCNLSVTSITINGEKVEINHGQPSSPLLNNCQTSCLPSSTYSPSSRRTRAISPLVISSSPSWKLKSSSSTNSITSPSSSSPPSPRHHRFSPSVKLPSSLTDFQLDTFYVRPSISVSALNRNDDTDDTDGDDTFDENFYRPRTSSMRTSRDLAALARRRGSKELM